MLKTLHTVTGKHKPTLVFLHDSLGCITLWRDFPKTLADLTQCNLFVYDRQGYGESAPFTNEKRDNNYLEKEADVLHDLLREKQIKKIILFGHSDGGSISLIYAAKYPAHVLGVITEGAHIFVEDITLNGIRAAVDLYQTTNLNEKLQKYHGDKTPALFNAWTQTWLSPAFRSWNIEQFLTAITCPVLVIQGDHDEYGSEKQVDGIIQQVKGRALKLMVPGVGHTPHKEALDEVLNHAAAFIASLVSGSK